MSNWQHKTYWDRGFEDSYEVHEFVNETNSMGLYETEEYLNKLELLLKEAHDLMDELNNAHQYMRPLGAWCNFCHGEMGYDQNGLLHEDDCILVRIRSVIQT